MVVECKRRAILVEIQNLPALDTKLVEVFTTKYFNIVTTKQFDMVKPLSLESAQVEYLFRGSFEEDIESETDANGKEIKSRLTISLFYNGLTEEPIKTWVTESSLNSIPSQYNRMFDNKDAEMKKSKPLEKLLWEFEQSPVTCQIRLERDEVAPSEIITVELTDFEDDKGNPSREFNRIVIQAVEGEILGGTQCEIDPALKVFQIGTGTIKFSYKAPSSSNITEDTIFIYNSCNILKIPLSPLQKTELKDKIAEKKVQISENRWVGTLKYHRKIDHESSTGNVKLAVNIDVQMTIPLNLAQNKIIPWGTAFNQKGLQGPYSISYKKVKVYIHKEPWGTQEEKTTSVAECTGQLSPNPTKNSLKLISLNLDREKGTYDLLISFAYDGGCKANTIFEVNGEKISTSSYDLEQIIFDSQAIRRIYPTYPFQGKTDGKVIHGQWISPRESPNGKVSNALDDTNGLTVEWNLTKSKK
jgi:hypothetical protein